MPRVRGRGIGRGRERSGNNAHWVGFPRDMGSSRGLARTRGRRSAARFPAPYSDSCGALSSDTALFSRRVRIAHSRSHRGTVRRPGPILYSPTVAPVPASSSPVFKFPRLRVSRFQVSPPSAAPRAGTARSGLPPDRAAASAKPIIVDTYLALTGVCIHDDGGRAGQSRRGLGGVSPGPAGRNVGFNGLSIDNVGMGYFLRLTA